MGNLLTILVIGDKLRLLVGLMGVWENAEEEEMLRKTYPLRRMVYPILVIFRKIMKTFLGTSGAGEGREEDQAGCVDLSGILYGVKAGGADS